MSLIFRITKNGPGKPSLTSGDPGTSRCESGIKRKKGSGKPRAQYCWNEHGWIREAHSKHRHRKWTSSAERVHRERGSCNSPTSDTDGPQGVYSELQSGGGLREWVARLAGHVASVAATL